MADLRKLVEHGEEFGIGLIRALELHEDGGFFIERYSLILLAQVLGLGEERLLHVLAVGGVVQSGADAAGDLAVELAVAEAVDLIGVLHGAGESRQREGNTVGHFGRARSDGRQLVRRDRGIHRKRGGRRSGVGGVVGEERDAGLRRRAIGDVARGQELIDAVGELLSP